MLARRQEVFARSTMERIERARRVGFRKGLKGSFQHRRNRFQERETSDECPRRSALTFRLKDGDAYDVDLIDYH